MLRPFRFVWHHKKAVIVSTAITLCFVVIVLVIVRIYSAGRANGETFTTDNVPAQPVAIIFGAGIDTDGSLSAMLQDRVAIGAKLYQTGKVKALLLTGDNHINSYNEPEAMRQYALKLSVPDSALVLDYAGFRTYDSCYRARDIFKVDQAVLVTQAFHLDRALLICNSLGIKSVGVAADVMRAEGYDPPTLRIYELREYPSTANAVLNLLTGHQPTFLGDPLPIFTNR
jgi:SanA protein